VAVYIQATGIKKKKEKQYSEVKETQILEFCYLAVQYVPRILFPCTILLTVLKYVAAATPSTFSYYHATYQAVQV
jgi:regulator of sigma D